MNVSNYPAISVAILTPKVEELGHEIVKAATFLLIPTELLYFSIYFHSKGYYKVYRILTFVSIAFLWLAPYAAPISCGPPRCLQHFAVAIGTMKLLDIWARRQNLPAYTAGKRPPDWKFALIVLTELRYEYFTPNHIRVSKNQECFNEKLQLVIHGLAFAFLQAFPQNIPTILAWEVLLAIYIIWTSMQLVVRYKSSPALFGPLYMADSLTGFWSETWHNVFASPCNSLAYVPLRHGLPKYGVPSGVARSFGVLGVFGLMAAFHMYAIYPVLDSEGLYRIGMFFVLNGIATVVEATVWGHQKHWMKAAFAWVFQTGLATWVAAGLDIPKGLSRIRWKEMCDARY